MCNLYSVTKGQSAIRDLFAVKHDRVGNLPPLPGIFPDYMAPMVRVDADGERELVMARWGMPGPPQFGGQPVTNIRNVKSPHWRRWLGKGSRCVVPATSFCEYEDPVCDRRRLPRSVALAPRWRRSLSAQPRQSTSRSRVDTLRATAAIPIARLQAPLNT